MSRDSIGFDFKDIRDLLELKESELKAELLQTTECLKILNGQVSETLKDNEPPVTPEPAKIQAPLQYTSFPDVPPTAGAITYDDVIITDGLKFCAHCGNA